MKKIDLQQTKALPLCGSFV